jgi:GDPmannose 4,6-dehydratase
MKTALVTGISGQDGLYALELLSAEGYRVVGTSRDSINAKNKFSNKHPNLEILEWDLRNEAQIKEIIQRVKPCEIYNFAAYSSGEKMYENPVDLTIINGLVVTKILDAIKKIDPKVRFVQASSSEMFGLVAGRPQNEFTPFYPRSPYGASKLYGHNMINIYRERHDLFACSAILFNHESPYRGMNFVTRKITNTAAKIKLGLAKELVIGNLEMQRDWLFAGDAVRAMWMMLQAPHAGDYIVSSGSSHSVREFCALAFSRLGMNYEDYVVSSPEFFRPADSINLEGDPSKLIALGWSNSKSFVELVYDMVDNDYVSLKDNQAKNSQ